LNQIRVNNADRQINGKDDDDDDVGGEEDEEYEGKNIESYASSAEPAKFYKHHKLIVRKLCIFCRTSKILQTPQTDCRWLQKETDKINSAPVKRTHHSAC
jgi:hypothetical protein